MKFIKQNTYKIKGKTKSYYLNLLRF